MGSSLIKCPHCGKTNRIPAAAAGHPRCGNCRQDLPWIVAAGDADFAVIAEQSSTPALIDFWAAWCGPCRMVSPVLDKLAQERAGQVKLVKVDVDTSPALSQRFDIQAIPTMPADQGRHGGGPPGGRAAGRGPPQLARRGAGGNQR